LAVAPPARQWETPDLVTALQQAGRAPVTRKLLVVAAVAAMLGLVVVPALDEMTVGGWFGVPQNGSRGLGQPGQAAEPMAPPATADQQSGIVGHPRSRAKPHARGHSPKLRHPKGKPDTAVGRAAGPPARNPHAPPRPGRR
jgi:hypothetical protein